MCDCVTYFDFEFGDGYTCNRNSFDDFIQSILFFELSKFEKSVIFLH